MRATCWKGKHKVSVDHVPDPVLLNERDAIVRVTATTICGSDLHLYNGFVPTMHKGDILGHELVGEVVDVGRCVKNLKRGDRVVVPFAIACGRCESCEMGLYSACENSNPNGWLQEEMLGGQAEYVRVPYADFGPLVVPDHIPDDKALFLSDIFPTGYMGAEMCEITPRKVIAVWGAGPVGQFAIASARLLGAERIIAIDRVDSRLELAMQRAGATDVINFERTDVLDALRDLTADRGPDACMDCVGMEDDSAVRQAILSCRSGGIVAILGVYAGLVDKFPLGALMNRGITIRTGQCHVQRYMKPLLERIERGEIDPSFVVSHHMKLDQAPEAYDMFLHKRDGAMKIVLA